MTHREWLAALLLVSGHGMVSAAGIPGSMDEAWRSGGDLPPALAANPDEPPSAQAVAAYLAEVLMPGQLARRTPTGYAMLDKGNRVKHSIDVALTSHQCWKIKDGYQCRSKVRTTTTTPANGRLRSTLVEIDNDYQWRGGRLFSARLEAMRPQTLARDDTAPGTPTDRTLPRP